MKMKPKTLLLFGGLAWVAFNVLKDKAGGDCGCSGGPRTNGAFGVRGSTKSH